MSGSTARDRQRSIGASEIGGCRRKVWHRIEETPVTNPGTLRLAAKMGTAIHSWIEDHLAGDDRFLLEIPVEREGIKGHVDCFDIEKREVIDWKTIKMSGIPYFPSLQQRWQVQIYGWMLSQTHVVESVCLVGLPRDGSERDIVTHVEPYDELIALEAFGWLLDVRGRATAPKPEKARRFCRDYCQYFDPTGVIGCSGLPR